jgi:PEP-CTERM motif
MPSFSVLWSLKVFSFSGSPLVSQVKHVCADFSARAKLKGWKMKKLAGSIIFGALVCLGAGAQSDLLSSVQNWTGSGTNEAGLVIDWYNGTTSDSLLWGYRWNGSATGEQMFDAIVAGDPRLFAEVSASGEWSFGTAVYGLGFAATGDEPIQLSPPLSFNSDNLAEVDDSAVVDGRTALNPDDLWMEGWNTGYWSFWVGTGAQLSSDPSAWTSPETYGMTAQTLEDDDVDGFSFAPGFNSVAPADIVAASPVPEPSSWALLGMGALALASAWRKWNTKQKSPWQQAL